MCVCAHLCVDRLTHVNGERVDDVALSIVRALVGGKSGTMVSLTFRPIDESNGKQITVDVVRRGRPEKTIGFSEWLLKVSSWRHQISKSETQRASLDELLTSLSPSRRAKVRIRHTR